MKNTKLIQNTTLFLKTITSFFILAILFYYHLNYANVRFLPNNFRYFMLIILVFLSFIDMIFRFLKKYFKLSNIQNFFISIILTLTLITIVLHSTIIYNSIYSSKEVFRRSGNFSTKYSNITCGNKIFYIQNSEYKSTFYADVYIQDGVFLKYVYTKFIELDFGADYARFYNLKELFAFNNEKIQNLDKTNIKIDEDLKSCLSN